MNENKKKRIAHGNWLVTLPLVGLAVIYTIFFFLPHQEAVGKLRAERTEKQNFIAGNGNLVLALDQAKKEMAEIHAYNMAWAKNSPGGGGMARLFGRINVLAQTAGVHTTRFDPQPVVKHEHLTVIPLEMGFTGSFAQVFAFLREIERLPRTIWMRSVNMEKTSASSGEVQCEVVLEVFADNSENSDRDGRDE